jgi:hypothetical protein
MCADLVKVHVHDHAGRQELIANLEDISPSGACIQLETAIQSEADIEIVCSNCNLKGTVRYCRFVEIGYDVGIAFDEPQSWSRKRFEPKHLLEMPGGERSVARGCGGVSAGLKEQHFRRF